MNRFALVSIALSFIAGCDSLVDGNCRNGYDRNGASCNEHRDDQPDGAIAMDDAGFVVTPDAPGSDASPMPDAADAGVDAGPDAPPDALADATPDAFTCAAPLEACYEMCVDLQTDADHCGSCTHSCASGICTNGHCEGEQWGHIVAIGHDYTASHAAQRRVLVNAVSLGLSANVGVAWFPGTMPNFTHVNALQSGMTAAGRAWHTVAFPTAPNNAFGGIDVVIVAPDKGDGDAVEAKGAEWAMALDEFLRDGGVIVVLDGAGGQNHRFGHGANLFDVDPPTTVTGQPTAVVDGTDSVAQQVVAPYLAESTSVGWTSAPQPVVTTMGGAQTIVFHVSR